MALLGGAGIATGARGAYDALGGVSGIADKAQTVGNVFSSGPGSIFDPQVDTVELPSDLPRSPTGGATAGRAFKHEGFSGPSIRLTRGLYNYDDLSQAGLHDELTSARVQSGYVVKFYPDVQDGTPGGEPVTVRGPGTVNLEKKGMNDAVSAIVVMRAGEASGGGTVPMPGDPGSPVPEPDGPTGGGTDQGGTDQGGQKPFYMRPLVWAIAALLAIIGFNQL